MSSMSFQALSRYMTKPAGRLKLFIRDRPSESQWTMCIGANRATNPPCCSSPMLAPQVYPLQFPLKAKRRNTEIETCENVLILMNLSGGGVDASIESRFDPDRHSSRMCVCPTLRPTGFRSKVSPKTTESDPEHPLSIQESWSYTRLSDLLKMKRVAWSVSDPKTNRTDLYETSKRCTRASQARGEEMEP